MDFGSAAAEGGEVARDWRGAVLEGGREDRVLERGDGAVDLQINRAAFGEQEMLQIRRRGECAYEACAFGGGRDGETWVNARLDAWGGNWHWRKELLEGPSATRADAQVDGKLLLPHRQPSLDVRCWNVREERTFETYLPLVHSERDAAGEDRGVLGWSERARQDGFGVCFAPYGKAEEGKEEGEMEFFHRRGRFLERRRVIRAVARKQREMMVGSRTTAPAKIGVSGALAPA